MKVLTRRTVSAAMLGAALLTMLACAGCSAKSLADAVQGVVPPMTSKYTVGGSVTGLSGTGLTLEDNGGDALALSANGPFTFATTLAAGANYAVTVRTQPSNPAQTCTVTDGSGAVATANVSTVAVICTNNAPAAVTSTGSPVGAASTAVIDATGGSITSPDARLTVTVPPGAVAAATTFSIQPITNQTPGGIGNAYRLGPDGAIFSTPVSISVQYSSADLAGTVADALSLVYKYAKGRWAADMAVTLDATAQTVTVSSPHFSDWALTTGIRLYPQAARVGTGESQVLTLFECDTTTIEDSLMPYMVLCLPLGSSLLGAWSANGIAGGNGAVGTVTSGAPRSGAATYTAPGTVPASNPVAVSVTTPVINLWSRHLGKEVIVSNITVGGCSLSKAQDCTYTGTSTTANSHWQASAQVTWKWQEFDPADPSIAIYEPVSGSVTLTDLNPACSVDSAPQAVSAATPTRLAISYHTNPPTVWGNGTNLTGWTESCTPPETPPATPGAVWWADEGTPLTAGGTKIEGNVNFGGLTSTFTFTAD